MNSVIDTYRDRFAASGRHYERARRVLPGGATRSLNCWAPHPVYLRHGSGAYVHDVDGNRLLDLLGNYTALVLGHADQRVVSAVAARLELGTSLAFSTELEAELAELLVARVPSVDQVRFTGSGTEAAMFAIRIARAATGRSKLAKMEGGFHGTHDDVAISVRPALEDAGPRERPRSLPETSGLIPQAADNVVVLPFNRPTEAAELIREHADDLAAVIVEPMLGVGGMIPAAPPFLATLRHACREHGIVLIFDEVITLRLAPGGAQEMLGVEPDLTVMGKVIGGGLPIGAVGGVEPLMAMLEAQGGHDPYDARSGGPPVYQGGTFTGNPLSLAAGIATLQALTPTVYAELNERGDRIRRGMQALFDELDFPALATGAGSLFNVHMTRGPMVTGRDARAVDSARQHRFFLELLNQGVVVAPRGMGAVCAAMRDEDVELFLDAVGTVVAGLHRAEATR